MGSFKLKLVAYFLVLSLVPLAAASWGFATVARRSETRLADARLQAGLRATLAAYEEEVARAGADASALAQDRAFERALARGDRSALVRMLRTRPHVRVETAKGMRVGPAPRLAAERRVAVVGHTRLLGQVIAFVPLDRRLVSTLARRSGLDPGDELVLLRPGRTEAGIAPLAAAPAGATRIVTVGGTRYRALVGGALHQRPPATLAVLTPQARIDSASASAETRLLLGILASLLLVGCVAYLEGRAIVRTVRQLVDAANAIARGRLGERVPARGRDELALLGRTFNEMADQLSLRLEELEAERGRLRDAIARFGEALASTHDTIPLMRVIVETAVEATGAAGGLLTLREGEMVATGDTDALDTRLELPLIAGRIAFGTLHLYGSEFDEEARLTAASLAAHAVVALENVRLHRIVERQALLDGLTGLANRRQCEEALAAEISRAQRFGSPLAVVLADLDDFKAVNDRHGHPAGDQVLRELATVLHETLRESDLAGRWGGEEFVLLLPGTDAAGGMFLADRVRDALATRTILTPEGVQIDARASFGVAAHRAGMTEADVIAEADAALYAAKRGGKNRVEAAPAVRDAV